VSRYVVGMFMWLLAVALGGHPLVLPPDEDPAEWSSVLELVGLETGVSTGDGPVVVVHPEGDRWRLRASDGQGEVRETTIAPPSTAAEREAVAQLAASLVEDLSAPDLPPLPPLPALPPPPPPPPKPVPTRVRTSPPTPAPPTPQPPEPAREPVAAEAVAVTPPEPEPVPEVPAPAAADPSPEPVAVASVVTPADVASPEASAPPDIGAFAWGSVGLHLRATVLPAVALGAWGGGESRWVRAGLGVEGTAPAGLTELQVEARVQRWSAWGGAWVRLGPVETGVVGGAQRHRYVDDGGVDGIWVPTSGVSVALFPARTLRLEGRLHRDLRRVDVYVGPDRLQVAEPWSAQIGVAWVLFRRANGSRKR